ncbi:MAG: hypothetical protein ACT4PZ_24330 [Panacagrimonas sp.]
MLLVGANLGCGLTAARADTYAELLYANVNIDFKPFPDEYGVHIFGSVDVHPRVTIFGGSNFTEFQPSGPVLGRYRSADDWTTVGAEFALWKNASAALVAGGAYQSVKLDEDREGGSSFHLGGRWRPHDRVRLGLNVGYLDLVVDDITLIASAAFALTRRLAWSFRVEDHSDWDFTTYETGLRWYFD